MDHENPISSKAERKIIEKNRRNKMKTLYSKLNSLVPRQSPEEVVSLSDQLEGAENYIRKLQENLEEMKKKKNRLLIMGMFENSSSTISSNNSNLEGLKLPNIDIHVTGSAFDVVLITGLNCKFLFTETVRMLHQEGAEVVSASFYVVDQTVFHTIYSKIGECRVENGAARICERLRKFVYDAK